VGCGCVLCGGRNCKTNVYVGCDGNSCIEVHHINLNHDDDRSGNKVMLCSECHSAVHRYRVNGEELRRVFVRIGLPGQFDLFG
jgi:hypothetical protein